jgi:ATP-dependent helicase HrpB
MRIDDFKKALPVASIIDDLKKTLADNPCAVLQAPPGAGKTTVTPLALLNEPWLRQRKIIVLAPRRLAARAAAIRMAEMLGEKIGQTVGYRVRMDSRIGRKTRIEVVTEGVLTRMLQSDPALDRVGLVIFDEFHERNLDGDLGLALCLDMQGVLNDSLRLLVMSATLDTGSVADLLGRAPVITCPGRTFPVETRYVGTHVPETSPEPWVRTVIQIAREESGNILMFLPGAAEIRYVARQLVRALPGPKWIVAPLFGNLSASEQARAIRPPREGKRKIVLATSIAETSLTIEGIRIVVDTGLQRLPRMDLQSGLTRLVTRPVSKASADQRRGRAGRLEPGICLRLWSRPAHAALALVSRPEICDADLAALALELAVWGVDDPGRLKWLDPPSQASYDGARCLLQTLGALDDQFRITPQGRKMAMLPVHPRLARMICEADSRAVGRLGCDLAALLIERDFLRFEPGRWDADMQLRLDLLHAVRCGDSPTRSDATVDRFALRRTIASADALAKRISANSRRAGDQSIGRLLAWAYPDRIAQRRKGHRGRFLLAGGRGAYLDETDPLASESYLIAVDLDGKKRQARIYRAASYSLDWLLEQYSEKVSQEQVVGWDQARKAVSAQRVTMLDAITLKSEVLVSPDAGEVLEAMLNGIRQSGLGCLPWSKALLRWRERVLFLKGLELDAGPWPDTSDLGLDLHLEQWLAPYLAGVIRLQDLARLDLKAALYGMLTYEQHRLLDQLAPTHLEVPSGSRIPIDYSGKIPVLAVRLQEMFGLTATPTVAGGRQNLLIHLLSPAGRPVQITEDLTGFWRSGYAVVKKELKGRYPKHYWPDDPLKAEPTARVRPSKQRN